MPVNDLTKLNDLIKRADAVSFDVFDTLFLRQLRAPEDAFDLLGQQFGIDDFRARRERAQQQAFRRMQEAGLNEITLEGIYACFEAVGVAPQVLCEAEYRLELQLTVPNPRLVDLFRKVASEKPVVITSDMYLPRAFFDELFRMHDLHPAAVFVSAERNATKRDRGELFDIVARELGLSAGRILHIGDNPISDIVRGDERGFATFHYVDDVTTTKTDGKGLGGSLACGLPRVMSRVPAPGTFEELGFRIGGPAAIGFLDWIGERAKADRIDHVLFVSRDGYVLNQLAGSGEPGALPPFSYFMGSRVAFKTAATNESNFDELVSFMTAGSHGLRPIEVLERVGVVPPSDAVMRDLGFGENDVLDAASEGRIRSLLRACRIDILRVCRRNRRGLYQYLVHHGIRPGMRVAMVDVGWNGTTQEGLVQALGGLMDVQLFGYYFCLNDSTATRSRAKQMHMSALLSADSIDSHRLARVYANRVIVELLFSAQHDAVIGYVPGDDGIATAVEDPGRVAMAGQREVIGEIHDGIYAFVEAYRAARNALRLHSEPVETVSPVVRYADQIDGDTLALLSRLENFDAWGSTRNNAVSMSSYLEQSGAAARISGPRSPQA